MIAGATSRIVLLGGNTRGWRNRLAGAGALIWPMTFDCASSGPINNRPRNAPPAWSRPL
jgi:hypothetical protein